MRPQDLTLRCYAEQQNHCLWVAVCVDLCLATQGQTYKEARQKLNQQIKESPNWFVDISATLEQKLAALDAYATELRDWPHPRSRQGVEHLARWRGATIGCEAAEAFVLARYLA